MFTQKPTTDKDVDVSDEKSVQGMLDTLGKKRFAVPAEFRFNLFKSLLKIDHEHPETVSSKITRMMFDYDKDYFIRTVKGWKTKTQESAATIEKIDNYFKDIKLPDEMTFQDHAYYCYRLCALASGVLIEDLDAAYDKQLHTMVTGTIHPTGKWSIKQEVENQYYAKYIYHVSKTGLAGIPLINRMTSVPADGDDEDCEKYWSCRLVAAPCGEEVNFDGVPNCTAKDVLDHDYIHSGFLKYALDHDKERFWSCMKKIGIMSEKIKNDSELAANPQLRGEVEAAFFLFTHELTTSFFVHGWPRRLPKQYSILKGEFASAPQIALRWTAKFHLIAPVFANEIENEAMLLESLGLNIKSPEYEALSDHERVKLIMEKLNPGYEWLHKKFNDFYGHQSWFSAAMRRACCNQDNFVTRAVKSTFSY